MNTANTGNARAPAVGFEAACALLETALRGETRRDIVGHAASATDFHRALVRLREGMRAHAWPALNLTSIVARYDTRTRKEGFHVLNDWDGLADHVVNADTIPVDVLNFLIENRGDQPPDPAALAILLDYYLMHVLALLSLRVWDEGRADAQLDRLQSLLDDLQGPIGSGQLFAADAETLILVATCHYEREERGYDLLLERVRTLNPAHRLKIALGHAASMGSHLRFGFEATYARDTTKTRDDNVADYPWLCFALATLMREYARGQDARDNVDGGVERDRVVEALLNGLSADARAFVGDHPPASLASSEAERVEFRDLFRKHRSALLEAFERYRPPDQGYSPLAFFFNFSHNVLKGSVVDALLRGEPWPLTLNDLLTGVPADDPKNAARRALAETLMGYARAHPSPIRGRMMPVIVYDPATGRQAMSVALKKLEV